VPAVIGVLNSGTQLLPIQIGSAVGAILGVLIPLALAYAQLKTDGRIGPGVTVYAALFLTMQMVLMYFFITQGRGSLSLNKVMLKFIFLSLAPLGLLAVCGIVSYLKRPRK
jgi:hypothetical protein